jgi:uncharacterized protein
VGSSPTPGTIYMQFVFDFIIVFLILISGYWMYVIIRSFFYDKKQNVHTKLIRIILLLVFTFVIACLIWGSFVLPRQLNLIKTTINLEQTIETENIQIAFISDLHVGPYKKSGFIEKAVNQIIEQQPDLVILGGDYLFVKEAEAKHLAPLEELGKRFPVYAVTGNHEFHAGKYGDKKFNDETGLLRTLFEKWHINMLNNENSTVFIKNSEFNLVGIEDLWSLQAKPELAFENYRATLPTILLSHNPDILLDKHHELADLILSGHTHGGQIRLPYLGSVPNLPTQLGRAYDKGLFKTKNGYLYITEGLGESGVRARFFSKPEISIITLDL